MYKRKKYKETREERYERLWNEKYYLLEEHKQIFGNLKIKGKYPEKYQKFKVLRSWSGNQRRKYKNNTLYSHRFILLSDLGFSFDPLAERWYAQYSSLVEYHKKFGTCIINARLTEYKSLYYWCHNLKFRKDNLNYKQKELLDKLGFIWGVKDEQWLYQYSRLVEYQREFGSCLISWNNIEYRSTYNWCYNQRIQWERLSAEKRDLLDKISFTWEMNDDQWHSFYESLKEYHKKFGNCIVNVKLIEYNDLYRWCIRQRMHKDRLTDEQKNLLDNLGFIWDAWDEQWLIQYSRLVEYYQIYGTCVISRKYREHRGLYNWCSIQRVNRDRLTDEQRELLNNLGFEWRSYEERWYVYLERLKEYRKIHGHCNVPNRQAYDKNYPKELMNLNHWVNRQRQFYNKGILTEKYLNELLDIGFEFDPHRSEWDRFYEDLKGFKKKFGNTNVQINQKGYKSLGDWVQRQRQNKEKLSYEKLQKLKEIGFIWDTYDYHWNKQYKALKKFKKEHGHCLVTGSKNRKLALWVDYLRKVKRGKYVWQLTDEQMKQLEEIDFIWDPKEYLWDRNYKRLVKFHLVNKHFRIPYDNPKYKELFHWVLTRRKNKNILPHVKLKMLNRIGFDWKDQVEDKPKITKKPKLPKIERIKKEGFEKFDSDVYNELINDEQSIESISVEWINTYNSLLKFREDYGNCNVYLYYNQKLYYWIKKIRYLKQLGGNYLTDEQISDLDKIGFEWNPENPLWESHFNEMIQFGRDHGHCNIRKKHKRKMLHKWLIYNRKNQDKLTEDQIKRLVEIGVVLDKPDFWEINFQKLLKYKEIYGTANVPNRLLNPNYPEWERRLGSWLNTQRQSYKNGEMTEEHQEKLINAGVIFNPFELKFEENFANFLKFKEKYGHGLVPQDCTEFPGLGSLVSHLRTKPVNEERRKRLDEVGFAWNHVDETWKMNFKAFIEFKEKFGHQKISDKMKGYEKLGAWCNRMRKVKRLGTGQHITEEQIRLLDSVGFDWDPLMTAWNIGFQKLLQYKAERGHCLVEVKRCMIEGLGVWVVAQRKNKKNLSQEQISCLDEIGFEWDADVAYRKRNNIKNINMSDDPEKGSVV